MSASISDHMYRMAVLAMCTSDATLDVSKSVLTLCPHRDLMYDRCVMMCVVHDLAEAQGMWAFCLCINEVLTVATVGDISPREGIPREEKCRLEAVGLALCPCVSPTRPRQDAMHNFIHDMLHATPAALRIEALWKVRPRPRPCHRPDVTIRCRNTKMG